jgi:hypothetical protein
MVQIRYQYTYSEVAASSSSMRSTGYTTATTSSSPALVSRESPEIICTQDPLVKDARPFDKCFVLEDPSIATSGDLTALRFSIPSTVKTTPPLGTYILNKLQVGFSVENPQLQAGIIPTTTWKVNSTNSIPGVCGEYRNGAFVIQAVSKLPDKLYRITDSMSTPLPGTTSTCGSKYGMPTRTIKTGVGVFPPVTASIVGTPITSGGGTYISNGGTGLAVDNVVYELSLFWHISSGYTPSMNPMYIPFDVKSVIGYINK